jgi:transcriptional regulator with XRE-family HTH domain
VSRLTELRKSKGLTQMDVASRLGCHVRLVTRWETGKGLPSPRYLFALAKMLKVKPEKLYELLTSPDASS